MTLSPKKRKSNAEILGDIAQATKAELRETSQFLGLQVRVWRNISMIAAYDPKKGSVLSRHALTQFLPYHSGNPMGCWEKWQEELLSEAMDASFITGVSDHHKNKTRNARQTRLWIAKLRTTIKELEDLLGTPEAHGPGIALDKKDISELMKKKVIGEKK